MCVRATWIWVCFSTFLRARIKYRSSPVSQGNRDMTLENGSPPEFVPVFECDLSPNVILVMTTRESDRTQRTTQCLQHILNLHLKYSTFPHFRLQIFHLRRDLLYRTGKFLQFLFVFVPQRQVCLRFRSFFFVPVCIVVIWCSSWFETCDVSNNVLQRNIHTLVWSHQTLSITWWW